MAQGPVPSVDVENPASDRSAMRVAAALLDSGRTAALAGHVAKVLSVLTLLLAPVPPPISAFVALVLVVCLWPAQCWYAVRGAVDASLFRVLGPDPGSLDSLDSSLARWRLGPARAPRSAGERATAALRIWRRHLAIVGVQASLLLLGLTGALFS